MSLGEFSAVVLAYGVRDCPKIAPVQKDARGRRCELFKMEKNMDAMSVIFQGMLDRVSNMSWVGLHLRSAAIVTENRAVNDAVSSFCVVHWQPNGQEKMLRPASETPSR